MKNAAIPEYIKKISELADEIQQLKQNSRSFSLSDYVDQVRSKLNSYDWPEDWMNSLKSMVSFQLQEIEQQTNSQINSKFTANKKALIRILKNYACDMRTQLNYHESK